jgi:hypothetical protein
MSSESFQKVAPFSKGYLIPSTNSPESDQYPVSKAYWHPSGKYVPFAQVANTLWGIYPRIANTLWHPLTRVFDEISFLENFAKLATKRFSCFAKMRDEFREFRSFAKLPRLRKKWVSRNTKIAKTKKTWSKNTKFNFFSFNSCEDAR